MRYRLVTGLFLLVGAGIVGAVALRPVPPRPIIGMVRATEIKIAPEVSGHIAALPVKADDPVAAGTVVAELSNPELTAAVGEAEAAVVEAKAVRDRVYAGIRQEEVDIAAREIEKANADLTLAQQQFRRISELAATAHASQQQLDNARAAVAVTTARLKSAQLHHAEAQSGPTQEERAKADAAVAAAEAALVVVQRRAEKLQIKAPVAGVVEVVVGELGEATVPGRTILTIADTGKPWFNFNIREDQLHGLGIGSQLTLIDGKDNRQLTVHVSEMRRLGDFATWRAARAVGDHDLNTFFIRADAAPGSVNLEPGVTVWLAGR
ncbi:MAG TPA: biotin/lipoyl-binding protein [Dongiaceae bacterium]|nr:biotin/lipoyl-binding protein [Dongiaceae bacterium]